MKVLTHELVNKILMLLLTTLIILSMGILTYFLVLRLGSVEKENQAYDRYISCVLSVPALDRNQAKIDKCWIEALQDTGVQVKRYDN